MTAPQLGAIAIAVLLLLRLPSPAELLGEAAGKIDFVWAVGKIDFVCDFVRDAAAGALRRAGVEPGQVQEVLMGNVLSAGLGQAPARQAALGASLPSSAVCTTVNKVCASGMKAIMLAAQSIQMGFNDVVVAGGMESMSRSPALLMAPERRRPRDVPPADLRLVDSVKVDGLWNAATGEHMGAIAEKCAKEMSISREDMPVCAAQDKHAIRSYERALTAQAAGVFGREIVHVEVAGRKGEVLQVVTQDEECSRFDPDKMESLRPAFVEDGSITAANSSKLTDGAAAFVLTSRGFAEQHGLKILAKIRSYGDAEQAPEKFPTTPALAIPRVLKRASLELKDVDIFEINEAFSAVDLANQRLLGLSPDQVNIHGGAVALGHPLGASGVRIVLSLMTALAVRGARVGVAGICNGGGGASALVLEAEGGDGAAMVPAAQLSPTGQSAVLETLFAAEPLPASRLCLSPAAGPLCPSLAKVVDRHLKELAARHLETRFVRLDAEKSPFLAERLRIFMLPTIAVVLDGKAVDYIVGFDELGGKDDFGTEVLERRLCKAGAIFSEDAFDVHRADPAPLASRSVRQAAQSDSNEDFD
eukprot:SM000060S19625  [mRNA]  locus=s60:249459:253983:+ [translate_table: standard]